LNEAILDILNLLRKNFLDINVVHNLPYRVRSMSTLIQTGSCIFLGIYFYFLGKVTGTPYHYLWLRKLCISFIFLKRMWEMKEVWQLSIN